MVQRSASANPRVTRNPISVVLRADGGRVDLVVAAIRDDNADVELHVIDHGNLVEVRACRSLQVTAKTLQWHVGRNFGTHELQSMLLSCRGKLTATRYRVTVTSAAAEVA